MITGAQMRAARALLGIDQKTLAKLAGLSVPTIQRMEASIGIVRGVGGGILFSLLGGSRFQLGGPAGAFIVLVAATVTQHGMEGPILATFLSGLMLIAIGLLRLGTFIKFIRFPVTVGIAVIIFASLVKELFGLSLEHEPSALLAKIPALWEARDSLTPAAFCVSVATVAIILGLRRWRPHWPGC